MYRGSTRQAIGDLAGAEADYRASIALAPHYSQPQNQLGRLLLLLNRTDEAFEYLSRAASIDESRWPELLNLASQAYPGDGAAILRAVNPSNKKTRDQTALYLISNDMDSGVLVSFVTDSLDDDGTLRVIRELIELKKFRTAYDVWRTRFHNDIPGENLTNLMIDGDFEKFSGENPGGFGWQAAHVPSKITIAVNSEGGFSGSRYLELRFNNEIETGEFIVDQLVPVSSETRYKLTFVSNSERLVSAGLPVVSVIDAAMRDVIAESEELGSRENIWKPNEIAFTTGPRTTAIIIGVRRARCQSSPCPIFGKLRLDEFVLTAHQEK
jgi:hypothetical protein